jgi:ribonuclease HII
MEHKKPSLKINKNHYEKIAWERKSVVCGIDEVGRGCLAGPLVASAVILPPGKISPLLKDSKLMTPQEREKALIWIKKHCWYGVGIIHNRLIDERNIWQATILAMKKAIMQVLPLSPYTLESIVIDAMPLNLQGTGYQDIPVHSFTQGERKSSSIAAASIVAKVTRDHMMATFATIFPGYHLQDHKGYAAKSHKKAIMQHEHLIIHRISFLSNTFAQQENERAKQQTIC